jgi:polyisoprenoid-binding protein YceI
MKLSLNSALAALVLAAPLFASAAEYEIDSQHANAEFKVKHFGLSTVKGQFSNGVTGTVNIDDKDISKSSVQVAIDVNTIDTGVEPRNNHLKSADFFDVAKFPKLTFKSTKVEKSGDNLKVTGDLTIHGVTKPVVLDVEELTPDTATFGDHFARSATASTKINRHDFGLDWNKKVGENFAVGDDVKIDLSFEMVKKSATPAKAPAK